MAIEDRGAATAVKDLLRAWDAAWAARDPQGVADMFTDDATWEHPSLKRPVRGRREVIDYCSALLRAFPDMEIQQDELLVDPDDESKIATHWVTRGTFRENLHSPEHMSFSLAATGDRVEFTGVALATLRDGKIESLREYMDDVTFQRQIGIMPPVGSRAERFLARLQALGARRRLKKNGG